MVTVTSHTLEYQSVLGDRSGRGGGVGSSYGPFQFGKGSENFVGSVKGKGQGNQESPSSCPKISSLASHTVGSKKDLYLSPFSCGGRSSRVGPTWHKTIPTPIGQGADRNLHHPVSTPLSGVYNCTFLRPGKVECDVCPRTRTTARSRSGLQAPP